MPNNGTSFIVSIERFKLNLFHLDRHSDGHYYFMRTRSNYLDLFNPPDYLTLTKGFGK